MPRDRTQSASEEDYAAMAETFGGALTAPAWDGEQTEHDDEQDDAEHQGSSTGDALSRPELRVATAPPDRDDPAARDQADAEAAAHTRPTAQTQDRDTSSALAGLPPAKKMPKRQANFLLPEEVHDQLDAAYRYLNPDVDNPRDADPSKNVMVETALRQWLDQLAAELGVDGWD